MILDKTSVLYAYLCCMKVPEEILTAASGFVKMFGANFKYLGSHGEIEYYLFVFPSGRLIGQPFVYGYKKGNPVHEYTDTEAFDIIQLFDIK